MSDAVPAPNSLAAFLARVRQLVDSRYDTRAAFEEAMSWPEGFAERELFAGELAIDLVAPSLLQTLGCDSDWLLQGVGEPFTRGGDSSRSSSAESAPHRGGRARSERARAAAIADSATVKASGDGNTTSRRVAPLPPQGPVNDTRMIVSESSHDDVSVQAGSGDRSGTSADAAMSPGTTAAHSPTRSAPPLPAGGTAEATSSTGESNAAAAVPPVDGSETRGGARDDAGPQPSPQTEVAAARAAALDPPSSGIRASGLIRRVKQYGREIGAAPDSSQSGQANAHEALDMILPHAARTDPPVEPPADAPDNDFNISIPAAGAPDEETTVQRDAEPIVAEQAPGSNEGDQAFDATIPSGSPQASDRASVRPSRVNLPRASSGEDGSDSRSSTTSDSVIIEGVDTDGDAERAFQQAIQRQHRMLREAPDRAGYDFAVFFKPADGLSSEFYDFIELADDRIAIVVADIAGTEGLEVWGDTAMAMRALRIFARNSAGPREVLIQTNTELVPDLMAESNMTVVYSELNLSSKKLRTAQSGHQPVMLYNATRGEMTQRIKPGGMVLGLVSGHRFDSLLEEQSVELHEGDMLLWYTEGVPETLNRRGEKLGLDGLERLMRSFGSAGSAHALVQFLQRRLITYRGHETPATDTTMVALKVGGHGSLESGDFGALA